MPSDSGGVVRLLHARRSGEKTIRMLEKAKKQGISPISFGLPNRVGLMLFCVRINKKCRRNHAISLTSLGLPNRV